MDIEQDDQCLIPIEASTQSASVTYDSVITDLLLERPVLDKIVDDGMLSEPICVTSDDFVQSLVDAVNQTNPVLECGLNNPPNTTVQPYVLNVNCAVEVQQEFRSIDIIPESECETVRDEETDDEVVNECNEEPAVKKRRRIVTLANDDDDDSDEMGDELQSSNDIPIVVESSELNDEHETPKPKCKKASTIMLKEIQARVLLESAVMIPADTMSKKKKNRILDSDEDENGENVSGFADHGVVNDISDIGLETCDPAADEVNSVDVRCNEIRDGDDDNLVMIQEEVFISQHENNFDIGTEIETCKLLDYEQDGSGIGSNDDNSNHSNISGDSPDDETADPMAGIFETDPSDSSQGEEIFGHDPQSENEFMTTSDIEKSRRLEDSENDRSSESDSNANENVDVQSAADSDLEEGEIRLNQIRQKLSSTSPSDSESTKAVPPSSEIPIEKDDFEIDEVKLVDLPSIKIIDVKTINDIVNSVDSSLMSNDHNNLDDNIINSNNHNNDHSSKGSSSKSHHHKNKANQDPFFDYSTSSSSDEFIPNEIYFGSPDLLARHQRRRARRKESRRNNHKHKRRSNFFEPTSSSSDSDSMDGRYSKKYFSHHNRNKTNAKNKKRKKRKNDRFYDRSRDIPPEVYFGDVQVPLHVLHSYGATSNSNNTGSSDTDSSAYRKNKIKNRVGRVHNNNINNNSNNNNSNNRRFATSTSRSRRYSSSSSISTVNSIVSPSRDNLIETMKRYLKAAGIMRQIKLNRLWEGCKSNKERADKILDVLREKGLEGEPTMAKCKELKIRLQTKKELEELNPNVIIVTEGRARRSTTRAATEKSLQTNPLELNATPEPVQPIPSSADITTNPIDCSSTLIKLKNVIDPDSD